MIIHLGNKYFPKNLLCLRKKYALSRRALSRLTGIPEYRIKGIEEGICYPEVSLSNLRRLREIFQLETEDLAGKNLSNDKLR